MMRTVSNRLLPLGRRYGAVLLAALLVFYVVRDPILAAVAHISMPSHPPNDIGYVPDPLGVVEEGAPIVADAAGPAPGIVEKEQNDQQLMIEPARPPPPKKKKVYKPVTEPYPLLEDHFPRLTHSREPPPVKENNWPPWPHVPEKTPLLIGFTRNWPLLLQCVSSYIAAGWPSSDIFVVENTGTFSANRQRELSLQNPFFLNMTALELLGVNVISTPTLFTFAQLQNFYLHEAVQRGWEHFFWSHQDVIVFSDEDVKKKDRDHDWDTDPYATIYERAVGLLRYLNGPDMPPWSTHFFAYDHLTLVKRDAFLKVGAWDTQIPFYATDCDMYLRLHWAGYWQPQSEAGLIFDVNTVLDDIGALFQLPGSHASFRGDPVFEDENRPGQEAEMQRELDMRGWVDKHGETWVHLVDIAGRMQEVKYRQQGLERNTWQTRQEGGFGEPFYRHPRGFEQAQQIMIDAGRRVFAEKWGHRGCDLIDMGIEGGDAWKLERDWDINEGPGSEGGNWGKDWMAADAPDQQ
ncbi:hypothetical protein DL766_001392 [Monosporascus sp. MC13-8B]|uniref:Nucleotide-diphospho-sugar transferase domain-containing protein n=1 Tax=Monosporascus cannonballus TaxID=155416 RepID=A0ABY0HHL7_9PEZI|nr:hypothetical protein DL762_001221 [Monosporascus cannonballus]RYO98880.1 hypothetical protein DL763_001923 [Monosporascus cannonballus]RYP37743.1 hypothetical protein DL766_001392 [Monosporascus sp. MC13-8B]